MVAFASLFLASLPLLGAVSALPVAEPQPADFSLSDIHLPDLSDIHLPDLGDIKLPDLGDIKLPDLPDLGSILTGGLENLSFGSLLDLLNVTLGGHIPDIPADVEKAIGDAVQKIEGGLKGIEHDAANFSLSDIHLSDFPKLASVLSTIEEIPDWLKDLFNFIVKIFSGVNLPSLPSVSLPIPTTLPSISLPSIPLPTDLPSITLPSISLPTDLPLPTGIHIPDVKLPF